MRILDVCRISCGYGFSRRSPHGSVTRAAKHLTYSQPAVSHHLARLEAETGARLVQRVGRGIRLTPEGEHLARRATEIVGWVDTAAAELSAMVGLRTGRVRIAGFQSAHAALVPHAAGTLRREKGADPTHGGSRTRQAPRRRRPLTEPSRPTQASPNSVSRPTVNLIRTGCLLAPTACLSQVD